MAPSKPQSDPECRVMPMLRVALCAVAGLVLVVTPAQAASSDDELTRVIERARKATVGILEELPETRGTFRQAGLALRGTGVHLREGYLITARHVVERREQGAAVNPERILILTEDLDELPARLIGVSAYADLAVYRIEPEVRALLTASVSIAEKEPDPGQEVFTVGYPLGWGPVVVFGRIGNPSTFLPTVDTRLLQADLSVCNGNSGGGLFNARGEIVGVMHAVIQTEQPPVERQCSRFAFGVPGRLVQRITATLIQGAQPTFAKLGIRMTAEKVGTRWRVVVAEAMGPALAGGIQKGDLLLTIDDTVITDAAQLKNYLIERTTPNQRVTLRVLRRGQEMTFPITLGGS